MSKDDAQMCWPFEDSCISAPDQRYTADTVDELTVERKLQAAYCMRMLESRTEGKGLWVFRDK